MQITNLLKFTFIYIIGLIISSTLSNISINAVLFSSIIALISYFFIHHPIRNIFLYLFILLFGIINYQWHLSTSGKGNINENVLIIGTINDYPKYNETKTSFTLEVQDVPSDCINKGLLTHGEKIKVNIYNSEKKYFYGDILKIDGRLKTVQIKCNPGGLDKKYQMDNIQKIINVKDTKSIKIGFNPDSKINYYLFLLHEKIVYRIKQYLKSPYDAILLGVLLGDTAEIPEKIVDLLQKSGLAHILSVSGLHVGILSYFIYLLLSMLPISEHIKSILNILILFAYAILTGATPPVMRSALMVSSLHLAGIFKRNTVTGNFLLLALLITLVVSPLTIFSIGLILSYTITGCLIYFTPAIEERIQFLPRFIRLPVAATLAAALGSCPLTIYFFYIISPISIMLNILIIPLVSLIMGSGIALIFGSLLFSPFAKIFAEILIFFITIFIKTTAFFTSLPGAYFYLPAPNFFIVISFFIFIFLIFNPLNLIKKLGIIQFLMILNLLLWKEIFAFNGWMLKMNFIDVGQGDAIFTTLPGNKNLLIDGGPRQNEVEYFLRHNGVWEIDTLAITHTDLDHVAGLYKILERFKVNKIYFNLPEIQKLTFDEKNFIEWIKKTKIKYYPAHKNDNITVSPFVEFKVFNPAHGNIYTSSNNNSIVTRLSYKKFSIFLTGDMEKKAEKDILIQDSTLTSTFLKIAHHGSKSSTGEAFLAAINPEVSIISVGRDNSFGHPHHSTLENIEKIGSKIYRTDKSGMISILTDGTYYEVNEFLEKIYKK
ncbi:DNA internalization-related competence protein ComEC/Rec2 [Candidatus Poribacteria bacterium]|nr:DNA internalization-related competence protein ComEC/Rec2 [Candidatus Poribacteria bacterium]